MFLLPRRPRSLIFTYPAKLFYTLRKFPVFIIPVLWDVKQRRAAEEGRPEHTTVKTPKLEFPLLFRTAARNSSGDLEELHAVTAPYIVSGVWSVRPHYSVCAPAEIQAPVFNRPSGNTVTTLTEFNCPSGNTVTTLTELPDTPCSYSDGTVGVSEGAPSVSLIFRPKVRRQRRQRRATE